MLDETGTMHTYACARLCPGDTLTFSGVYASITGTVAAKATLLSAVINQVSGGTALDLTFSRPLGNGVYTGPTAFTVNSAISLADFSVQRAGTAVSSPFGTSATYTALATSSTKLTITLDSSPGILAGKCACKHACNGLSPTTGSSSIRLGA